MLDNGKAMTLKTVSNLFITIEVKQNFSLCIFSTQTTVAELFLIQIYGQLKSDIFNCFAPTDVSKRRKASITSLGFGDNDLWIAAIALQHQLTLVSCDSDFQRMQQARSFPLESWMSKP
jgi:hypothetical protein